ncbi:MAG: hypothetical protein K2M30_02025 [Desulfovibrionaceae bacterium]|nr:hypothetical protein [Desulfovibrionaceae bacterium]
MTTKGVSIIELDVQELIKELNKAFCDEWLAYYQYWIGAEVVAGMGKHAVESEFREHAQEELEHATELSKRIIQLGGTPIIDPREWFKLSSCGYIAPEDPYVTVLLEQNIKSEQCAIGVYSKLLKMTAGGKDPVTHNLMLHILEEEVEHESDLQQIIEDIALTHKRHQECCK